MKFGWHEEKRQANLAKHGLDFAAAQVFNRATFTFEDSRFEYNERRWVTIGLLGWDVVIIVHTESEDEIRIISMRRGNKHEQELYFRNLNGP